MLKMNLKIQYFLNKLKYFNLLSMAVGITIFQIFICLGALISIGVLQSISAYNIKNNSQYDSNPKLQDAYRYLVIGACISIISTVLTLAIMFIVFKNRES